MKYILGKKSNDEIRDYISWSAYSLWKKNKEDYRKKYYENIEEFSTKEMLYGKKISELLESNHESLRHIPRYSNPEHRIEVVVKGVKILAYLDSFCPDTLSFYEYKTSHTTKDGKPPWDIVKVHKHKQLDWYSLLIKLKYGKVKNDCELIWLETDWEEDVLPHHKMFSRGRKLKLTGKVARFKRKIYEYQRKALLKDIIKTVKEISKDFNKYKNDPKNYKQIL